MKTKQKGFTLVELLVVIAIIAILFSITLVSYNDLQKKTRDTRRISDVNEFRKALDLYLISHGTYPATSEQIVIDRGASDTLSPALEGDGLISKTPTDVVGISGYVYRYNSDGKTYTITIKFETDSLQGHPAGDNSFTP